jgi:hypothetical protein
MKKLLLILALLMIGCNSSKMIQTEQFGIYHISSKADTTFLNWNDLKVLNIDSLQDKHLELNAER